MEPVITFALFTSLKVMTNACNTLELNALMALQLIPIELQRW